MRGGCQARACGDTDRMLRMHAAHGAHAPRKGAGAARGASAGGATSPCVPPLATRARRSRAVCGRARSVAKAAWSRGCVPGRACVPLRVAIDCVAREALVCRQSAATAASGGCAHRSASWLHAAHSRGPACLAGCRLSRCCQLCAAPGPQPLLPARRPAAPPAVRRAPLADALLRRLLLRRRATRQALRGGRCLAAPRCSRAARAARQAPPTARMRRCPRTVASQASTRWRKWACRRTNGRRTS